MRVGLDARFLAQPGSGVHRYVANLLLWLPEVAPEHEYFVYYCASTKAGLPESMSGRVRLRPIAGPPSLFSFSPVLLLTQKRDRLDLFHSTAYTLPAVNLTATVLTLHDLTFEVHPAWYASRQGNFFRAYIRYSAMRANRIIADSEATQADIRRYYGLPPKKVSVVYLGGAASHFAPMDRSQALEQVRRHSGLAGPFLLYVGAIHERKNMRRLIEAYGLARRTSTFLHRLLIVGAGREAQLAELDRLIAGLGLSGHVKRLPPVNDDLLPIYFAAAEAFIYPSLYEGFGLPIVEAMAMGTPVITSRSSSLAEVAGPAAVLVDPRDVSDMAGGIARILTSPELRAELSARGLERARQFSWASCARETAQVYQAVISEARRD